MRMFVALLPPPAATAELAAALDAVRGLPDAGRLRWTAREGWHLTLAFLGEVPDPARSGLDERLGRAARRHGPYDLRLAGAGRFGDRALWAGAEGDLTAVGRLADSVRAAARRAGVTADEEYGFHPHLTLARALRGADVRLRPFVDALAGFRGPAWTAADLHLVAVLPPRSGVPGEQPRYRTTASWPLGRPGERPADGDPAGGPQAGPGTDQGAGPDSARDRDPAVGPVAGATDGAG
jgi:RNA 2',3'-cyclic 3'-phosphodiesterase